MGNIFEWRFEWHHTLNKSGMQLLHANDIDLTKGVSSCQEMTIPRRGGPVPPACYYF